MKKKNKQNRHDELKQYFSKSGAGAMWCGGGGGGVGEGTHMDLSVQLL